MTVRDERQVLRQVRMDREERDYAQHARNARLAQLVTPELPALLERLALDAETIQKHAAGRWMVDDDPCGVDAKAARALAAYIREALALETEKLARDN